MPGYRTDLPLERAPVGSATLFGLSTIDRACIRRLVGHSSRLSSASRFYKRCDHTGGTGPAPRTCWGFRFARCAIESATTAARVKTYPRRNRHARRRRPSGATAGCVIRVSKPSEYDLRPTLDASVDGRVIKSSKNRCRGRDSNPRPTHYECVALPAELPRRLLDIAKYSWFELLS